MYKEHWQILFLNFTFSNSQCLFLNNICIKPRNAPKGRDSVVLWRPGLLKAFSMTEDKAISSAVVVMNISALQDLEKVVNFMCIPAHAAAQGEQSNVTSVFIRRLQIWPSIPETVFIFNGSRLYLNIEMRGIIYKYHKLVVIPSCTWICVCVYVHMCVRTCVCLYVYEWGTHLNNLCTSICGTESVLFKLQQLAFIFHYYFLRHLLIF